MNKKIIAMMGFSLILIGVQVFGCGHNIRNKTAQKFESYSFNDNSSLISRVSVPPDFLLSYLKEMDGRSDYTPYQPGRKEKKVIEDTLASLPPLYKEVLRKRLIGIYFINNFLGNGLSDWIIDSRDNIYTIMVFNSSVFSRNMSGLLTEKEKTCFSTDDPAYDISINCGEKLNGFYYILFHEAAHAVDYVKNVTPYTEIPYKKYLRLSGTATEFTRNLWTDYDRTRDHFIFTGKVFFYGSAKPALRTSEAMEIYRDLANSPYASLYGTLSWAEDLAEITTFYHITHVMKQPYVINVLHNGKTVFSVRPMESRKVKDRLGQLKQLYDPGKK